MFYQLLLFETDSATYGLGPASIWKKYWISSKIVSRNITTVTHTYMHRHLQLVWQQLLCGSRGMADYKLLIPIVCLCHLCQLRHEKESEEKSLLWQFDLTVFGFSCGCSSNMCCTYATMCTLCAGDASTPFERDICEKLASGVFWLKVF